MPREVIDYKALAERINLYAQLGVEGCDQWQNDLRTVVTMLNEAAEAKPVAWIDEFGNAFPLDAWKPAKRAGYLDYHKKAWKPLFTHPAPQPQRPYGTDTMSEMGIVPMCDEPERQPVSEPRSCTCHPDDNPPVPCAQQYALNECRAVHGEPTEAQIAARDALLDFISENGTASEGVQHYLDRYVRAALAAKEKPE